MRAVFYIFVAIGVVIFWPVVCIAAFLLLVSYCIESLAGRM